MKYQYEALTKPDAIRLLKFKQCSTDARSEIDISLVTHSLEYAPSYHALSYCWGAQRMKRSISCDGKNLVITQSLYLALQHVHKHLSLLHPETETNIAWLWVDQLCIDQSHIQERNHQVNLMGKIYSQAVQTVIWLGRDKGFAQSALGLIQQIYTVIEQENPEHGNSPVFDVQKYDEEFHKDQHKKRGLPDQKSARWSALRELLSKEWFTRLWVFQEAVLSKNDPIILCGEENCSWNVLSTACAWLWRLDYYEEGYVPRSISNIESIRRVWKMKDKWAMSGLLYLTFDRFNATNARDKVFGLLGLANHVGQMVPEADYTLAPSEVYCRIAKHMIYSDGCLAILSLPPCHTQHVQDLYREFGRQATWQDTPSWTPSLDNCLLTSELVDAIEDKATGMWKLDWRSFYKASGDVPSRLRAYDPTADTTDWSVLELDGLEIDTVDTSFEINSWTGLELQQLKLWQWVDPDLLEDTIGYKEKAAYLGQLKIKTHQLRTVRQALRPPLLLRLWDKLLQVCPQSDTVTLAKSIWRATTAGMNLDRTPLEDSDFAHFATYMIVTYSKWGSKLKPSSQRFHESFDILEGRAKEGEKERYEDAMRSACTIRRCFVTKKGRVGVGSSSLRKDDAVVVFFGAGTPHLLRRWGEQWLFIGDCYVDGVMEGQGVRDWNNGEVEQRQFLMR